MHLKLSIYVFSAYFCGSGVTLARQMTHDGMVHVELPLPDAGASGGCLVGCSGWVRAISSGRCVGGGAGADRCGCKPRRRSASVIGSRAPVGQLKRKGGGEGKIVGPGTETCKNRKRARRLGLHPKKRWPRHPVVDMMMPEWNRTG
jgi:hypothetical protein